MRNTKPKNEMIAENARVNDLIWNTIVQICQTTDSHVIKINNKTQ